MQENNSVAVKRVTANITKLLAQLLKDMESLTNKTKTLRVKINSDLYALVKSMPAEERGVLLSLVATQVQEIFNAGGSPKVDITGGCVGRQGIGIRATDGDFYAGVCVTGSLDQGITGGGIEVGGRC